MNLPDVRETVDANDRSGAPVSGRTASDWLRHWAGYVLIAILSIGAVCAVRYSSAPRFDETGYLILAESLTEGRGYREIDQPGSPPHSHFPPGWPALLALSWLFVPDSPVDRTFMAHVLVAVVWLISILCWNRWFVRCFPVRTAIPMSIALAGNWAWIRLVGELRSETSYIMLSAIVLLAMPAASVRPSRKYLIGLGAIAGAAILTRHVGIALLTAIMIEFAIRRQLRASVLAGLAACACLVPWIAHQLAAGHGTQAELLAGQAGSDAGLMERVADQSLFYVRRLPDSLFGPFVETATVFRQGATLSGIATVLAILFAGIWLVGAVRLIRKEQTRPAGLYLACTMVILIVWPFTEAGRFLIPLVPLNIAALTLGLESTMCVISSRFPAVRMDLRSIAAAVALACLPFGLHTMRKAFRDDPSQLDARFEAACRWIDRELPADSIIAARHPGDVYWRSGHLAVPWPVAKSPEEAALALKMAGARYVFVDTGRFVGAEIPEWLTETEPGTSEKWFREISEPEAGMRIYEIGEVRRRER